MILLDTNVISALMQQEPDEAVVRWLDGQPAESIGTTSITVFEVWTGLKLLASGQCRRRLELAFTQLVVAAGLAARGRLPAMSATSRTSVSRW